MGLRKYLNPLLEPFGYQLFHTAPGAMGLDAFRDLRRLTRTRKPVVFDVGANSGQTIRELRRRFDEPVIHAFEPSPTAFAELQANCGRLPRVCLNNVGLGRTSGVREFHELASTPMSSFLRPGKDVRNPAAQTFPAQLTTVDEYCQRHGIATIDILKTDTQGYDLEVLRGATRMLDERRVRLVYAEIILGDLYEGLPRLDEILSFLLDRGFELVAFYRFNFLGDRASWTDALFVNPSCPVTSAAAA
jgi:FkbM family methyltransferase